MVLWEEVISHWFFVSHITRPSTSVSYCRLLQVIGTVCVLLLGHLETDGEAAVCLLVREIRVGVKGSNLAPTADTLGTFPDLSQVGSFIRIHLHLCFQVN
jgi:hypothetical protein